MDDPVRSPTLRMNDSFSHPVKGTWLKVASGPDVGKDFFLIPGQETIRLGSHPDNDFVMTDRSWRLQRLPASMQRLHAKNQ